MRNEKGFTLIELLIVIAIIGIIAGIAVASLRTRPQAAKEAVLKENLYAMRDVIDQYFADKGKYPESLETLVEDGYMRKIPVDPITDQRDWNIVTGDDPYSSEGGSGVINLHSSSGEVSTEGTAYSEW